MVAGSGGWHAKPDFLKTCVAVSEVFGEFLVRFFLWPSRDLFL